MRREVLPIRFGDAILITTHHVPASPASAVGVLFLNAGPAPRAGNSDLSAHAADRLAARGYHVVRVDLPGLGDSSGASAPDIETYWLQVLRGRNDKATAFLVREVRERLGLDGLVVGGLCAGSVTAIRVAASHPEGFAGLLLLEPEFRIPAVPKVRGRNPRKGEKEPALPAPLGKLTRRMHRVLKLLGLVAFPPDANRPLLRAWIGVIERGVPALAAVADGLASHAYVASVRKVLSPRGRSLVTVEVIGKTNHILTAGDAPDRTQEAIERWMVGTFPPEARKGRSSRWAA